MTRINPCPFCGSSEVDIKKSASQPPAYYCECLTCEARGPWAEAAHYAMAGWNRRAYLPPQDMIESMGGEE